MTRRGGPSRPTSPEWENRPDDDAGWVSRIRKKLAAWYPEARRALPWRADRDPYRILVSELMLVQTTVAAVVPYYGRFLDRFPTVAALAAAPEAEVLAAWEGLGYYRRARQLHAAARRVVEAHGGAFPDDPDAVRALPGVGRYIAGAVLSFAFDRPAPILEANTQRVLARWLAWREELRSSRSQARLWEAAARLVPPEGAGEFNQAFMELGALICTPKNPSCLVCPVAADCRARSLGLQDSLPVVAPRAAPLAVTEAAAVIVHEGRFLIVRRGAGGLWADFWEFPTIHLAGADPAGRSFGAAAELAEGVRRLTGVEVAVGPVAHTIRFGVTKHKVELRVHEGRRIAGEPAPGPQHVEARWESPEGLTRLPLGATSRRVADWASRRLDGA